LTADLQGSGFPIEMLSMAWVEDLPVFASSSKEWKLKVGVDMMV
jgi:hypothetical protein